MVPPPPALTLVWTQSSALSHTWLGDFGQSLLALREKIRHDNSINTLDSPDSTRQRTRKAVARGKRSFESMML